MATPNYNLPTITGNMSADVVRDMNALAGATDDAIKKAVECYGVATGTNTLVMTLDTVKTYSVGMLVAFKNTSANTGAVTLNINGLGAKSILRANGTNTPANALKAGGVYQCRFDGVNFMLLGEGGEYGNVTTADVVAGKIFGTDDGLKTGTATIQSLGGKRWASGNVVATSTGNKMMTITGLSFTPSLIVIINTTRKGSAASGTIYTKDMPNEYYFRNGTYTFDGTQPSGATTPSVVAGGFSLVYFVWASGDNIKWYAVD